MREKIVWTDGRVRDVLRLLKSSGYFELPASKGYDLRKKKLGFGQRMAVIKLFHEARYLFDEAQGEKPGDPTRLVVAKGLALYSSNVKRDMAAARRLAGLTSKAWKVVPFAVLPTAKKVKFSFGKNRKTFITEYPGLGIKNTVYTFDHKKILKGIDYSDEENDPLDQLTAGYGQDVRDDWDDLDDLEEAGSFFRMTTVYGDVSSTDYHPATQSIDDLLENQIGKANEKYAAFDANGKLVISGVLRGVSAWTNTDPKRGALAKPVMKNAATNFNRPEADKRPYKLPKPEYEWRLVCGKKVIGGYHAKKNALFERKQMEHPERWHLERVRVR